jgi:hypothetical protein
MLIVSNGAFKSGSTWLYNILVELTVYPAPPVEYLNPEWRNPSIVPDRLSVLLQTLTPDTNYLVKNHFGKSHERDLLLSNPHVRVLDIQRDLRDVVVSAYYHARRKEGYTSDFNTYYWEHGRKTAQEVVRYHELWAVNSPQVYVSSYERLHEQFAEEVSRIATFLNRSVSADQIDRIHEITTLDSLRERYHEQDQSQKFFRKGIIGDWQNHFDEAMLADLDKLSQAQKPSLMHRLKSRLSGIR